MNWQYTENGLPVKEGRYHVAVHYFEHGSDEPAERIWERYFNPADPESLTRGFAPVGSGTGEIYAWCPVEYSRLVPPPYKQEKHAGGLTDSQLIRLLVCQAQGLDDYYVECNKLGPDSGNDCLPFCPFGVTDTKFFDKYKCGIEERRLMLMYFAAKRLAELTGNPIGEIIKTPYGEAVEDAQ